ncbi:DUF126 domain-containing protein [Roseobacter denitrificans]|uniref:Phosphomevalonate dehydratase small subunit-like domain-containing protein n=1 Tax=Roseobacter denitrificans (strain ATCC 33942 / OCh 114) TaxID=375451 RepID=Q161U5_ROSDO|nr:DUF126 domain-containing protein [Roseobacter denitrificans]ABG33248.1 conserved hypothetical protein [Roseobacter denitrificans OCh 114]AVL52590.1 DUF126 domain-containing protein [Roseobacter denitrificans]SFG30560.1 predicted aconitase subunit 2 [Roseobacter denitrificans OCh 114]
MRWQGEVLCEGRAKGEVLRIDAPLSFWGGVDPATSRVVLAGHPQYGVLIKGKIVVLHELIGSSSSSAVLLELIYRDVSPLALILGQRDAILPMGVVVARQMGWSTPPVLLVPDPQFASGVVLSIDRDGGIST